MPLTLALSMLCENPFRRTGLSTLFHEFVGQGLRQFPDVRWLLFAGPDQSWEIEDRRIEVVRAYPANNYRRARLVADHWKVGPDAKRRGADVLLTIGFVPTRAPLPVVMHVFALHHLQSGGGLRGVYRRRAIRGGVRRASLVIANSEWTAQQLVAACPDTAFTPLVSPEGVQHDRFRPSHSESEDLEARRALRLPPRYLLWSSNFYPYKRADRALAAYAALPEALRDKFPLVLIGGDWEGGLERARLDARQLGVERQTQFLGWIDDRWLPAAYRGATAHVLSTTEETFGRSVLEAMACGCPCVLQDLPVLREVAGDAAEFVDYANTAAAAARLQSVCEEAQRQTRLRAAGLARAAQFSFERLARERINAVRALVRPGR